MVQHYTIGVHAILKQQARTQARLAVLRTGIDCEIARCTSGAYPTAVIASDPLTGESLHYDPDHSLLWSGGADDDMTWTLRKR